MLPPAVTPSKTERYAAVKQHLAELIRDETDQIAVMATIVGELFQAFDTFDWVGFYRVTGPATLKIGPYQGGHGCLVIPFERGVCGKCAREKRTQIVADVARVPYHIACSATARSEIVVPVVDRSGALRAVLDIDSDTPSAFDAIDQVQLQTICAWLGGVYPVPEQGQTP
jgi:GAF domain-containing protein